MKTEYQEPYHALQFSPYYSYSTLLLAGSEGHPKSVNNPSAGKAKKKKDNTLTFHRLSLNSFSFIRKKKSIINQLKQLEKNDAAPGLDYGNVVRSRHYPGSLLTIEIKSKHTHTHTAINTFHYAAYAPSASQSTQLYVTIF